MLGESISLQLGLLLLSLKFELLLNLLTALLLVNLEGAAQVSLEVIIELVHGVRVRIQNLDVVDVVVTVTALHLVEQVKAILQFLIKLHMMDGLLHLSNLDAELVLLI